VSDVATASGPAVAQPPAGVSGAVRGPEPMGSGEACPLCGSPLQPEQEWCLRCGAAARTRLAATPNWRAPIAAIVAAVALALGVLTAALVALAGGSSPTKTQVTRTVTTTAPAAATPAPASPTTAPAPAAPATSAPANPPTGAKTTTTTTSTSPTTGKRTVAPGVSGGSTVPGVPSRAR